MSQIIQLRRSSTPGSIPLLVELADAEFAINLPDKNVFYSNGSEVVHLNHAANIVTDSTHRFVTDSDIASWNTPTPAATDSTTGVVQIGSNIDVDGSGVISIAEAASGTTGVLTGGDWDTFNNKQDDLGYIPLDKAGDTMTGDLTLAGPPTDNGHAANKAYVDNGLATKLALAGGTMTGALVLASNPVANLGAATKQYVDTAVSDVSGSYAAPVQDTTELTALSGGDLEDKQMRLVEDDGAIYRYDEQSTVAIGTEVFAPDSVTPPDPGRWIKVQAATQSHNALNGLQGGAAGDYLHLTTAEKNGYDSHLVDTGLHLGAGQAAFLDAISVSASDVNTLTGISSNVQGQLDDKEDSLGYVPVNKAGDTMTGLLVLSGDPTANLGAATKQYVDNRTIDGGSY
jgi:hypothetical protein